MAAVPMPTMDGMAYFSATGSGTPADPYIIGLTTSTATAFVLLKTLTGGAYFGCTGSGTPADPYALCASTS